MHLVKVRIDGNRFPTRRFYPFNIPTIEHSKELTLRKPVVFFLGENGSGKSTLLDAIARKCGIHIWDKPRRHLAHNNPFETRLKDYVSIAWTNGGVPGSLFRAETFRDFADFIDDVALCDPGRLKYHGGYILNTLSHGQGILAYLGGRFHIKGLYLLDEPESALSPASQISPGAQIFSFDSSRIEEIAYEDTTHYKLYKQFFADRSVFLGDTRKGGYDREG
jgi:predicted ATPase